MRRREVIKLGITGVLAFAAGFYSRSMPSARPVEPEGKCFIEIHDLDPWNYNQGYMEKLDDYLDETGIHKREYFLIPANRDDIDALKHNPDFVDYIKKRILGKHVLGHHGLLHWPMDEEKWIFEFTHLNREETREKCEKALEIHEEVFGRPPDGGEAPPNWSFSSEALRVFLDYYPYVCTYKVVFPRGRPPLIAQAFAPTFGITDPDESVEKFREELEYYEPTILRIVFHPQDVRSEGFEKVFHRAFGLIEDKGYELSTYKEVFA